MSEVNSQTSSRSPHWPALDGWRGFTIWFAISVHAGYFTGGGVLSLDTFFALSGFLITGLLLREWQRHEGIDLLAFWARRARRLLPALFVVLAAVVVYAAFVASPLGLDTLRGRCALDPRVQRQLALRAERPVVLLVVHDALTGAAHVVAGGGGAVLPGVAARRARRALGRASTALGDRRDRGRGRRGGVGAIASAITMVALYTPGGDVSRVVLRHRHARAGDARRCSARGGGAAARPRAHPRRADRGSRSAPRCRS